MVDLDIADVVVNHVHHTNMAESSGSVVGLFRVNGMHGQFRIGYRGLSTTLDIVTTSRKMKPQDKDNLLLAYDKFMTLLNEKRGSYLAFPKCYSPPALWEIHRIVAKILTLQQDAQITSDLARRAAIETDHHRVLGSEDPSASNVPPTDLDSSPNAITSQPIEHRHFSYNFNMVQRMGVPATGPHPPYVARIDPVSENSDTVSMDWVSVRSSISQRNDDDLDSLSDFFDSYRAEIREGTSTEAG